MTILSFKSDPEQFSNNANIDLVECNIICHIAALLLGGVTSCNQN